MQDVSILINDLHKSYRNGSKSVDVIRGMHMVISRGDYAAVIGPSGAGKSTLLHLMGALDFPDKGKVILNGTDIYALSDRQRSYFRRKVGFVFQFYHLLPEFNALENVMLPALVRGGQKKKEVRDRATLLLENVGLKDRLTHKPKQLSGGEQQRVAIARALINEPDFLLCDEPTGNLDSHSGAEIKELLISMSKKAMKTLVVVTHQDEMTKGADKVFRIIDGSIE